MRNRQRRLSVRKPTAVQVGYVEFFVIPVNAKPQIHTTRNHNGRLHPSYWQLETPE